MKLIHYTFRNLSIPLLIILTAWACCFYFVIMHEIDDETNDSLENYKEIIIKSVLADSTLLRDHVDIMTKYYIREVPEAEVNWIKTSSSTPPPISKSKWNTNRSVYYVPGS